MARFINEDQGELFSTPAKSSSTKTSSAKPSFSRGAMDSDGSQAAEVKFPTRSAGEQVNERPNKYGGHCSYCSAYVPEGMGTIMRNGSRWVVRHLDGQCGTNAPTQWSSKIRATKTVPDAIYTVISGEQYTTIRTKSQDPYDDFMPGEQILAYLSGPDNRNSYTSYGHITQDGVATIWKKHRGNEKLVEATKTLLGDPRAAAFAYAQESGCCAACGRTLSTPESLANGFGPECAKKFG